VSQEIQISNIILLKINVGLLRFFLVAPVKAIVTIKAVVTSNNAFKQKCLIF
jgi:hypothetical protein